MKETMGHQRQNNIPCTPESKVCSYKTRGQLRSSMGGTYVGESTGVYTHNPLGGMREVFSLVYSKGTQCHVVTTFQVTIALIV